jgi:hypothetical protein
MRTQKEIEQLMDNLLNIARDKYEEMKVIDNNSYPKKCLGCRICKSHEVAERAVTLHDLMLDY